MRFAERAVRWFSAKWRGIALFFFFFYAGLGITECRFDASFLRKWKNSSL